MDIFQRDVPGKTNEGKPLLPKDALAKIGPAPPLQGRGEVMKIEDGCFQK